MKFPLALQPGQQIGKWTLIERVISFSPEGKRAVSWVCFCSCKPEVRHSVGENSLRRSKNGASRSCGCLRRTRLLLEDGQGAIRIFYRQYRRRAARLGHAFELTLEDFEKLIKLPCVYCSRSQSRLIGRRRKGSSEYMHPPLLVSGLDRVDSKIGYLLTPGQVVPAHTNCNSSKSDDTVEVFGERQTRKMQKAVARLVRLGFAVEAVVMPE